MFNIGKNEFEKEKERKIRELNLEKSTKKGKIRNQRPRKSCWISNSNFNNSIYCVIYYSFFCF